MRDKAGAKNRVKKIIIETALNNRNRNYNDELIGKLNLFIRKYYDNRMLRGGILFVALFLVLFLTVSLFEFFFYSNSLVRALLFYGFLLLNSTDFTGMIFIPFLRKKGILKGISLEDAAKLIGGHFPEIDDKLLNTLQLHENQHISENQKELWQAAIDLRISQMRPFRFHQAVNFRNNFRYIKYAAIPVLTVLLLFCLNAELFTKPTQRIVHYNTYFEKPSPYHFEWLNATDSLFQNEDITLMVKVIGNETPEKSYVEIDGVRYGMERENTTDFSYTLKNLQKNVELRFVSEEVQSPVYKLYILPKPSLIHFSVSLEYPAYLHKINESVDNNGNITIPEGTRVTWKFHTAHTEELCLRLNDRNITLQHSEQNSLQHHNEQQLPLQQSDDRFTYGITAMSPISYSIFTRNRHYTNQDSLQYFIDVIPDAYPSIKVESSNDSIYFDRFYFKGIIDDDHGFRQLYFVHYVTSGNDTVTHIEKSPIPFQPDILSQHFYHYFDAQTMALEPGQCLHYYFEVWDNDGVHGSKLARTYEMDFKLPTLEEIKEQSEQVREEAKEALSNLMKENESIMQRIEALQKKMIEKNEAGWQEKKELEKLLKEWESLKKELENISENQQRQQELESQYESGSEEILQKQEELQRRIDELFSDEMKQTMSELQRLMEKEIDKDKLNQALDKIKFSTEELNKQLDKDLALFKRLEVEKKLEDILQKSNELANEQLKLAEETANDKNSNESEIIKKQQKIQQEFQKLTEDIDAMQQMNKELEDPYNLPDTKEIEKQIQDEMRNARQELQEKKKNNAASHQQKAGNKIKEIQQQLSEQFAQSKQEELAEDSQNLRKILQRIVQTSFKQEQLMKELGSLKPQDPNLKKVIQEQFILKDNLRMIEDSLASIAKRQSAIKPFVNKQINKINDAQQQILNAINETQQPNYYYYRPINFNNAVSKQQYVMTGLNDLGLMLAESLDRMQQQQQSGNASSSCKSGKCKAGGESKDSKEMKSLRQMQEELNRQLEEMRKQQQQSGNKEGGKEGQKPGQKQGSGSQSEQFARMAARQEAIRRMTQDYLSKIKKEGNANQGEMGNLQRMIKEMEQTEKELVNKILNQETINRQRNITTRMLQSERAEMQREKEDKRESKQGRDVPRTPPTDWLQQQQKQQQQTELYKTVPPSLNYFYKQKVNKYFINFE